MAVVTANASTPATTSFGLRRKRRITSPRSAAGSLAAAAARLRRRGVSSSSLVDRLGTLLHLGRRILLRRSHGRGERCNIVLRLRDESFGENPRQHDGDGSSLIDLALNAEFAAMQGDQALDDRQPEPGA